MGQLPVTTNGDADGLPENNPKGQPPFGCPNVEGEPQKVNRLWCCDWQVNQQLIIHSLFSVLPGVVLPAAPIIPRQQQVKWAQQTTKVDQYERTVDFLEALLKEKQFNKKPSFRQH